MIYKKILVTGGTGLLGTGVKAIRAEYPHSEFILFGAHECNLINLEQTILFVDRYKPDAILHLAAVAGGIGLSMNRPATLLRDNIYMNLNILEAARVSQVKKIVMTLSAGMYPESAPIPLKEESIHDGRPHVSNYSYSFAKRLIEPSIRAYKDEFGLNAIGLVSNGIFGENGNFSTEGSVMLTALIRRFYENRNTNGKIVIWGDGAPLREYTYSHDLARIFMWSLENYNDTQILNVGSTEELSVKEIALLVAEYMGVDKGRLEFDSSKPAGIHRKGTDNSRFLKLSGFQYTPFRVGLKNTIKWFCENYDKPGAIRI